MRTPKHRSKLLALLIVCAFAPSMLNAQDRADTYIAAIGSGCITEISKYCSDVPRGEARLLACLYAHENKLSDRCGTIVMSSLERLGMALGALANVVRVCQADAQRLCNGMIAGNGNLVGCLSTAKQSVSAQCNATLDAAFLTGSGER